MIFLTVGTHEQGFDRVVKYIDDLAGKGIIKDVFIQLGYTDYIPQHCEYKKMIGYNEMNSYVEKSDIIITHGGPGSIMLPWAFNKLPIVVPRNPEYDEHVDNHQILFAKRLEKENKILAVYDIDTLEEKIINYNQYVSTMKVQYESNTRIFNDKMNDIFKELIEKN